MPEARFTKSSTLGYVVELWGNLDPLQFLNNFPKALQEEVDTGRTAALRRMKREVPYRECRRLGYPEKGVKVYRNRLLGHQ